MWSNLRRSQSFIAGVAFSAAALLAVLVAFLMTLVVESRSASVVTRELAAARIDWATVEPDGLQIVLTGTAPNEAARFRAVNIAGGQVESSRVRDLLDVTPARAVEAPRFSVEMLRNDNEIQLIGLLPEPLPDAEGVVVEPALSENDLADAAAALTGGVPVVNMLETAAYAAPDGWDAALAFGLEALQTLPRAKISVAADRISVTAISDSDTEKRQIEAKLRAIAPAGITLRLEVSAPRPVLTPFTLRFLIDGNGARFDACSADTEAAKTQIIAAATQAGMAGQSTCTVGLGVPSPRWAEATIAGIKAVQALGQGTITFSDADVSLEAAIGTPQATFDRVVGELQTALPTAFSLDAKLPRPVAVQEGPAEFTATLSPEGKVELRGRLIDEMQRSAVDAFAKAKFGTGDVYTATRLDGGLPDGWPARVLAGLSALAELESGSLLVRADTVEVSGVTGSQRAQDRITQTLSSALGQGATFKVIVSYDEDLDPLAALPTPQECKAEIDAATARQKITFTPGSAEIATAAQATLAALADILTDCPGIEMEIAGHTDSQGSETGNQSLSQARAEAVLISLQGRGVDVANMSAKGYGEATPIADNGTDTGREANRRIEFTLLGVPAPAATATPTAASGGAAPDFSSDTSASVAPTAPTQRPERRPAQDN
ncbi:MAG: OmpA family protein [Paracoccaceae bacterium]